MDQGQVGLRRSDFRLLGDPLPAHQLVLRACSERFAAQLKRWELHAESAACATASRPVLRVPLGSEAEVPSARAAIRFAYTGDVAAGSTREALEVRRQAAYLRIEGCAEACLACVQRMLDQYKERSHGVSDIDDAAPVQPPFLELYACEELWPVDEPGWDGVLASATERLVTHFGDAVAALNTPLFHDVMGLPAVALEALLESDEFGTDSESSVLLLLAEWVEANHARTDAATRARLCGHVRLVQLSRAYLTSVLPALAADHEAAEGEAEAAALRPHPDSPPLALAADGEAVAADGEAAARSSSSGASSDSSADTPSCAGWFPITVGEAAYITNFAFAKSARECSELTSTNKTGFDLSSAWYLTRPRRQCLPWDSRSFDWHIPREDLEDALRHAQAVDEDVVAESDRAFWLNGFKWTPTIYVAPEPSLSLYCDLPTVFINEASPRSIVAVASLHASLAVQSWRVNGSTETEALELAPGMRCIVRDGDGEGYLCTLKHVRQPAAGADRGQPPLDAWSAYLRDGKVTGTLRVFPPPAPSYLA